MEPEALKILIADDNETDRLILQAIVRQQGHQVVMAVDGEEAVRLFREEAPDIVLLDALMPRMDGLEAARQIKLLAGEELVPIIFLTSLTDAQALAACLEAGGDDFLSKPYNRVILRAKIAAFNRMRVMHQTLQQQRDQIASHNNHMLREQRIAKNVFDNVAHLGCLHANNIKQVMSPLAVFNGDVLLACQKPSGGMHILLGDFTGHGLPAAIGAMPLAEIFYGMTTKGFSMPDVLREVNQKLKTILPMGFFCCACMVDLNFARKTIDIWMGGLPDCFLVMGEELKVLSSNHLPLGVLSGQSFIVNSYKFELADGDRFYCWSDGIVEAQNPQGEFFGHERLLQFVQTHMASPQLFEEVHEQVLNFVGGGNRSDDLSLVEIQMMPAEQLGIEKTQVVLSSISGPREWNLTYELRGQSLRDFNPIPLIMHIVLELPALRPFSGQIYTLLAELYSNALEHGILGLQSKLKTTSQGFIKYYSERERRLNSVGDASIRFLLSHRPESHGGVLNVRVEDSGSGFDYSSLNAELPMEGFYGGRGIPLLRALCRRLEYAGNGNIVEAEFAWHPE